MLFSAASASASLPLRAASITRFTAAMSAGEVGWADGAGATLPAAPPDRGVAGLAARQFAQRHGAVREAAGGGQGALGRHRHIVDDVHGGVFDGDVFRRMLRGGLALLGLAWLGGGLDRRFFGVRRGNFLGRGHGGLDAERASRRKRQGEPPAVPFSRVHSIPCPAVFRFQGADSMAPPGILPLGQYRRRRDSLNPVRRRLDRKPGKNGAGPYLSRQFMGLFDGRAFIGGGDPISMGLPPQNPCGEVVPAP